MKKSALTMAGILAFAMAGGLRAQDVQEELFSDTFPGPGRDNTKWQSSVFLDTTARLRVFDGKLNFFRNPKNFDGVQQVQWDALFVREYDQGDFLQIGATVRIPHKVRSGDGAFSLGIGLVSGETLFIELAVEDNAGGRTFTLFMENIETDTRETLFFDAPQNVAVFDLVLAYSASTDRIGFYWSIPGVQKLFRIGPFLDFSEIGGSVPRTIQPYVIGLIFGDPAVPRAWRVNMDDFFAFREDAP